MQAGNLTMRYPTLSGRGFLLPQRLTNSYDSAGQGRRAANWQVSNSGPVSSSLPGLQTLRNRSRHAVRNDPYASGVIDKQVANHIGTGIVPKSQHPDAAIRAAIQTLWQDWTEESDADGLLDFYGQQALAARALFESGECLVRLRPRPLSQGLAVPLQLQLLEPELLPHDKNEQAANGNLIRQGIEFNRAGQRVAYWMYPRHPGEQLGDGSANSPQRLVAGQILHLYEPLRPGQLRGVPHLSALLLRLKTLDEFDDAVLFRQEVANLFAGFIRKSRKPVCTRENPAAIARKPTSSPWSGWSPAPCRNWGRTKTSSSATRPTQATTTTNSCASNCPPSPSEPGCHSKSCPATCAS
jgi:lambda family phage portal protein